MSLAELETAVLKLPQDERLQIADKIWDQITPESGDDAELIGDLKTRMDSEEIDGDSAIEAVRNRHRG